GEPAPVRARAVRRAGSPGLDAGGAGDRDPGRHPGVCRDGAAYSAAPRPDGGVMTACIALPVAPLSIPLTTDGSSGRSGRPTDLRSLGAACQQVPLQPVSLHQTVEGGPVDVRDPRRLGQVAAG